MYPITSKTRKSIEVPDPHLDIASTRVPTNIKKLFKLIRYYFYMDDVLHPIMVKLAEYPVTDIIFDEDNKKLKDKYNQIFVKDLKLHNFIIGARLDRIAYGNCFVSIYYPFKRFLKCSSCGVELPIENVDYKFREFKFEGACPKCRRTQIFKLKDIHLRNHKMINLIRWDPDNIDVFYNKISGESSYWYTIPKDITTQVRKGNKEMLKSIPIVFFNAIKESKRVKFKPSNIFHFKSYTLSDSVMGWGKPPILPALKTSWLLQLVKKNIETICSEGIIPLDILFPSSSAGLEPHQYINLGKWKNRLEGEIEHWRKDKNYIPIMPIPVGWQRILGQQDLGASVNMVKELVRLICGAVGLPQEFIYGGVSYSGSNISLRIIENHFICDREEMKSLKDFIIDNISNFLKIPRPSSRFQDFKMADDIQKRAQLDTLNQRQKVSDETLLSEYGMDADQERDLMKTEIIESADIQKEMATQSARIQGDASLISAKYQVEAQKVMMAAQQGQGMMNPGQEGGEEGGGGGPTQPGEGAPAPANMRQGPEPLMPLQEGAPMQPTEGGGPPIDQGQMQVMPEEMAKKYANQLAKLDPMERDLKLQLMSSQSPNLYKLVWDKLQEQFNQSGDSTDMTPLPENRPPRRKQSPV